MKNIRISARPAHTRARHAVAAAVAFGLLGTLSLPVVIGGSSAGLVTLGIGLIGGFLCLTRLTLMSELARHGDVEIQAIANPLPHLPATLMPQDVLRRARELQAFGDALVMTDKGWASVCTRMLVDVALVSTRELDMTSMSRPVRWVDGSVKVGQLRMPPYRNDVWLVKDIDPPMALRHVDLIGAAVARDVVVSVSPDAPEPAVTSTGARTISVPEPAHSHPPKA